MEPSDTSENKETIFHYLDFNPAGSPAVLLLHGLGADGSSWGYQIPVLCEDGLRPIAPDLPGFGKTIPGAGRWTIQKAAKDTARLILGLVGGPVIVAGISLGGVVALQMALDFPQMVNRLVLINSFACLRPKRFDEAGYLLSRYIVTSFRGKEYQAEAVARRLFPKPEQEALRHELIQRILLSDQRVYQQAMQSLALFDARKRLSEIRMPVLVISGQNDSTVPLENQNELAAGISGAEHVVIPDAGHAVIADQAMKFNQVFLDYLKSQAF